MIEAKTFENPKKQDEEHINQTKDKAYSQCHARNYRCYMLNVDINRFSSKNVKKNQYQSKNSQKVNKTINSLHNNTYKIKQHDTKHTQRVISNTVERLYRSCFNWCNLHELFLTTKQVLKNSNT